MRHLALTIILASFLMLPLAPVVAQTNTGSGTQMLPPTQTGDTAPCGIGSGSLLTMLDTGAPGSSKSAINCVNNSTLTSAGNFSTGGTGVFGSNLTVGTGAGGGNLITYGNGTFTGSLTVNNNVMINGAGTNGTSCSPNGSLSNDGTGRILDCVNGTWQILGKPTLVETETEKTTSMNSGTGQTITSSSPHDLCVLSSYYRVHDSGNGYMSNCGVTGTPGGYWNVIGFGVAETVYCQMTCYDFQ